MAKHEIIIHENTSATKESAPYLGSYLSKETVKSDAFAAKIAEKCGLPAIQVQAIIAGAFDAIEELEKEELVRLHVDGFTVCGIITGSFPTADAKFDSERNALQLALRLDEGVRNSLADVTPSIVTDASLTRLRIDNLADIEVQRPYNLIHGKHVFRVAGFCMVLSDEGAETYLENAMGTKFALVVKPSKSAVDEVCDATPSETAHVAVAAVEVSSALTTTTARANAPVIGAALLSEAGEATEPTVLEDIKVVKESLAQPARILPESRADSSCNLADLYRRRFLSGPWSVTRRLEAAWMRGDVEEEQRLTAMLEEAVDEALEVEGTEP